MSKAKLITRLGLFVGCWFLLSMMLWYFFGIKLWWADPPPYGNVDRDATVFFIHVLGLIVGAVSLVYFVREYEE